MKNEHSIRTLCATLNASPSGYYDWHNRLTMPGSRAVQTQALTEQISAKLKDTNTKERKFEDVVKSAEQAAVLVLVY